jgi:NagD protein
MDGVLVREEHALPGAAEFLQRLVDKRLPGGSAYVIGEAGLTTALHAVGYTLTDIEPDFVGKPNPMMFRSALNRIEAHSENTVMVGDRMDTDVVAGNEAGLETLLVLTGSTTVEDVERYPFRPGRVLRSIAEAIDLV